MPFSAAGTGDLAVLRAWVEEVERTGGIESPQARNVAQSLLGMLTGECELAHRGDGAGAMAFVATFARTLSEAVAGGNSLTMLA